MPLRIPVPRLPWTPRRNRPPGLNTRAPSADNDFGAMGMPGHSPADGGQALVETALLLPVLLALAILVIIGAELLQTEIDITDAARAGAAAAAAAATRGASAQRAAQQAAGAEGIHLSCSGAGIPTSCVSVAAATGTQSGVQMEVVDVYDTLAPWWPVGGGITLHAAAAAAV